VQQAGLGSVRRVCEQAGGRVSSRPQALIILLQVIVLPWVGVPQCFSPLRVKEAEGNCLGLLNVWDSFWDSIPGLCGVSMPLFFMKRPNRR
jgi:hypothetical protein